MESYTYDVAALGVNQIEQIDPRLIGGCKLPVHHLLLHRHRHPDIIPVSVHGEAKVEQYIDAG